MRGDDPFKAGKDLRALQKRNPGWHFMIRPVHKGTVTEIRYEAIRRDRDAGGLCTVITTDPGEMQDILGAAALNPVPGAPARPAARD